MLVFVSSTMTVFAFRRVIVEKKTSAAVKENESARMAPKKGLKVRSQYILIFRTTASTGLVGGKWVVWLGLT